MKKFTEPWGTGAVIAKQDTPDAKPTALEQNTPHWVTYQAACGQGAK